LGFRDRLPTDLSRTSRFRVVFIGVCRVTDPTCDRQLRESSSSPKMVRFTNLTVAVLVLRSSVILPLLGSLIVQVWPPSPQLQEKGKELVLYVGSRVLTDNEAITAPALTLLLNLRVPITGDGINHGECPQAPERRHGVTSRIPLVTDVRSMVSS